MICALLLSMTAVAHAGASAPSFEDLIADLAAKIAAAAGPADRVRLVVLGDVPEDAARRKLESDVAAGLSAHGVRLADTGAAAPTVRVACSVNRRERVCAAEIRKSDAAQTVFATGAVDRAADARDTPLTLDMRHVFGQADPILDIALAGDRLVVLDPAALTLYQRNGAVWQRRRSQPVAASRAWPRDVRGRVRLAGNSVDAFLPGVVCRATLESFTASCADERQPWPLAIDNTGVAAGRNYFTTPEGLAFYGVAPLDAAAGARWLLAADRSRLVLLDEGRRQLEPAIGAGDDVAGVTACTPGAFAVVASRLPGGEAHDMLRLFHVVERHLVPMAASLALPGTLTALWAAPGSSTATAVVRDAGGDRYDALQIDVVCGR